MESDNTRRPLTAAERDHVAQTVRRRVTGSSPEWHGDMLRVRVRRHRLAGSIQRTFDAVRQLERELGVAIPSYSVEAVD